MQLLAKYSVPAILFQQNNVILRVDRFAHLECALLYHPTPGLVAGHTLSAHLWLCVCVNVCVCVRECECVCECVCASTMYLLVLPET